jgi:hypothetical protein
LNKKKTLCIKQAEEDANRVIKKTRYNSFTATKAIEQISQQIVSLAIEQVRVKLQTKQVPVFIFLLIALKCFTTKFCTTKSLKTQFTLIFLIFV